MCGRFTASFEFREIKILFNLQRDLPSLASRYNIAPSQEVPVIVHNEGVNELRTDEVGSDSVVGTGSFRWRSYNQCSR